IVTGRPHFMPALTVDQSTGTLVATWYDARNDPSRSMVARYIMTSIDGGQTFSPDTYLNRSITPFDEVTQSTGITGPVFDTQAPSNPNADATFGFGDRQSVVALDGQVYAVWSGNEGRGRDSKELLRILSATAGIAAGPRVISSTTGVASAPLNTTQAP